jgi:SAM-dependent methyltransferase
MESSLPEFDAVARDYEAQHAAAIRLSGEDTGYFAEYKAADAHALAQAAGCMPRRILDFGSGIGNAVEPLSARFPDARLTCLDVSQASLDVSRRRHGDARADYLHYDGREIPESIGGFELIFTACVFHHIPPGYHVDLLGQLRQRLAPGGLLVLFEHNPWNPLTRHSVNTCPFDANAVLIPAPAMRAAALRAGFSSARIRYRLFFPRLLAGLRPLERRMTALPLGAQYSLAMQ